MPKIWSGGHWNPVDKVARGTPLILSESEWKKRALKHSNIEQVYFSLTLVTANLLLFLKLMEDGPLRDFNTLSNSLILFFLGIGLILLVRCFMGLIHISRKRPLPGVYEGGIEVSWGRFVPFGDISGTRRRRTLFGKETLQLLLRPVGKVIDLKWLISGSEECEKVEWLIHDLGDRRSGPPRLVVYPHEGPEG